MIEAYSPEWWQARLGKVTASRIADVVARTKTGWGASRANYMAELIAERLTGRTAPSYTSSAMEWGTATEPDALAAYRFFTDSDAAPGGWIQHARITQAGATPDGLVYGKVFVTGLVEIKCPKTVTHIETLRSGSLPGGYRKQCLWQMACMPTADWVDYVSFDPRMPEELQLFVKRVQRSPGEITALEVEVEVFLDEIERTILELWNERDMKELLKRSLEAVE